MKWWCHRKIRSWVAAAFTLGALLAPLRARAEIVTWAGATAGVQDWFVTGNWIPSRVPTETDDVRITGNVAALQISFSRSVTVKSLVNEAVIRPVADFANFTILEVISGLTNRGEIRLESQRSDRSSTLALRAGGVVENTGRITGVAANGGRRILRGSINNRGTITAENGITLEIDNTSAQLWQQGGTIRADGAITVAGGRVRLEGGALSGDVRLFDPDLSVTDGMGSPSEVFVLGSQIRFRGNASPSFVTHVTTDFANFAILRCDNGAVNAGRIILDAGRSDRGSRIELGSNFRNIESGVIEIVPGAGAERTLNGTLVNQGRVTCSNYTATFTGTYQAAGGTVDGTVNFINATIIPTAATANPTELLLYGDGSVLKGNNPPNLRLRVISDSSNFTRLTVDSNAVNRGEILLESLRSDRNTRLDIVAGGSGMTNRGLIRAVAAGQGGRFIRGSLANFGSLRVDPAIVLAIENTGALFQQAEGSTQVEGTLQVQGGRFHLLGGSLSGLVQGFNVEHYAAVSMTSAASVDVLGSESRLVSNESERVTYHITSDSANFTTLRLLTNGVNRGRILLDGGRSDRGTRLITERFNTNLITGRIEVLAGPGGTRDIQGSIVNQGTIICTNSPAEFRGTYQSDGGVIEGELRFIGSTLFQTKDAPRPVDFLLYGDTTLASDNRANHRLHVISDFGAFSSLILSSNVVNRSLVSLESLRSDRTAFLRGADGLVRNGTNGLIVADSRNGGGREIVGALQNAGRIRLDQSLRVQGLAANHRNAGVIQMSTNVLDVDGASFVNLEGGRIAGGGVLDVSGVNFTNSGGLYLAPAIQRISVLGTFNQSATGVLDVDLAGLSGPGTGHDLLAMSNGRANLAGKLSVHLAEGFIPPADTLFRVLTAQLGVFGRFGTLTTVQVSTNRYLEAAYSANAVDLQTRAGSVSSQAPSIAVQPESQEVEEDAAVEFSVVVDGTGPFTFQWRFKGVPIPGATTARLSLPKARLLDAGNYDVVISSAAGTITSQAARLGVNPNAESSGGCNNCDFGDAADSYGTSLANDGARHPNESVTGGPYVSLGARVDVESDSLGNNGASLDDNRPMGQPDDEDGVVFTTPIEAGRTNEVRVAVVKAGYEFAFLNAWLDMKADGTFDNGDDHIIPTTEVNNGLNTLRFWVPANATPGATISRFRLVGVNDRQNPAKNVGPTGQADNGEVEDHPVTLTAGTGTGGDGGATNRFDFGDAPDSYRTTLAVNGPRHSSDFFKTNNLPYVILGTVIDLETNGVPSAVAGGDDVATPTQPDDEDGVVFLDSLHPGKPASVLVVVNSRGFTQRFLNAWVDFGIDGTFTNVSDKVVSGLLVNPGTNTISFLVPTNVVLGNTFARFRITAANEANATNRFLESFGSASNGEVEDYPVSIREEAMDWGDASESAGTIATTRAKNGPRHVIVNSVYLGKRVDAETDGRPTAQARGDDNNQLDDEDGVVFSGPLTVGGVVNVEVTASIAGKLEGWIDFNGNNSWADPGENIFNSINVNAGVNTLVVNVPAAAVIGDVFARFRFSTRGGYGLTGEAQDGEVEDYKVTIEQNSNCELGCEGSDFWLAFPGNQFPDPANPLLAQLRILGTAGNSVTVSIPGLGSNIVTSIAANGVANVVLPNAVDLGSLNDGVINRGIRVTSSGKAVSVYAISHVKYSSDGYLGLPIDALGTEYVVGAYPNLHVGIPELSGSQFVVTATRANTTVTITPAYETGIRVGKIPYSIVLTNAGDCYQLRNTNDAPADLTGTIIEADQPVAVFGGHQCTDVNSSSLFFCDYLVEQIPPVNRLGTEFFTAPLATRSGGDTVRVVAARNQTTLTVDGATVVLTNKGDVFTSFRTNATWITADKPVYTAQYASSSDLDGVTNADPFMVTVPGRSLFSKDITFVTAGTNFVEHYITIIASELTSSVTLDGALSSPAFTAIGSSGYRYARMKVAQGVHTLSATRGLGVIVYGWNQYESYAWPACLFFGDTTPPVLRTATNSITRSLPTNEVTCVVTLPDLRQAVTTTDNCTLPLDVVITQTPPAGTPMGVGTNKVVLSTRDSAGNVGSTTMDYIVTDPRGGTGTYSIHCPADIIAQCQSTNGAVVNFTVIGMQGCTPVPVETIPPSGSVFPRGTTEVVSRIIVDGVIQAECRFNITVSCRRRLELKVPVPEPGSPSNPRELRLDFDEGDVILEVADSLKGPWVRIPDPKPGMIIKIAQEKSRFYRIQ